MKFSKFVAAAATSLSILATTAVADTDRPVVGLVMKSLANEFFQNMMVGAQAHAEKRGDYELLAVGMQNETDFESQINAVNNFITQGVDAIVIAPADSRAMVRPLKRAMEAGRHPVNGNRCSQRQHQYQHHSFAVDLLPQAVTRHHRQ